MISTHLDRARCARTSAESCVPRFRIGNYKESNTEETTSEHGTVSGAAVNFFYHICSREKEANYPKSWAGVVADPPNGSVPKKLASDGTVPAFAASVASVAVLRSQATSSPISVPPVSVPACVSPVTIPTDLSSIMAAAIEAALQPMKERLEATIVPMQRTVETLQTEFVALRTQEKIEPMTSGAATDAKRLRLGSDV